MSNNLIGLGRWWWWNPMCWPLDEHDQWAYSKNVGNLWRDRGISSFVLAWVHISSGRYGSKWGAVHSTLLSLLLLANHSHSAKYPLAVIEVLLEVFGAGIGGGYDIGCKMLTTLAHSELGPHAWALDYTTLVGAFHGHVHNRLCQLCFLATYIKGMGLEDLEGCKHFFSKSNALAFSLHYVSVFHQQQKMVEFMKHMDNFKTYPNLSKHH